MSSGNRISAADHQRITASRTGLPWLGESGHGRQHRASVGVAPPGRRPSKAGPARSTKQGAAPTMPAGAQRPSSSGERGPRQRSRSDRLAAGSRPAPPPRAEREGRGEPPSCGSRERSDRRDRKAPPGAGDERGGVAPVRQVTARRDGARPPPSMGEGVVSSESEASDANSPKSETMEPGSKATRRLSEG